MSAPIDSKPLTDLVAETALAAAKTAGIAIRAAFDAAAAGASLGIEEKTGPADIVTRADREAEALIRDVITKGVPGSRILGEENGWQGEGEVIWYVDPIDGTSNFACGLPIFCVSIAAFGPDGAPLAGVVHDPVRDETFMARGGVLYVNGTPTQPPARARVDRDAELLINWPREGKPASPIDMDRLNGLLQEFRAVRRLGSTALHLAYVAAGRAAITYDQQCGPWDIAAGLQLAAAAGCRMHGLDGDGKLLPDLLQSLKRVDRFVIASHGYGFENSAVRHLFAEVP